jgi:UDP:flavonoid glycosyltransferase YjiC (YdhE family)
MRALITSVPGHGHLGPLIPLAIAIRDAGHEVTIATSAGFRDVLDSHGVAFEPCGPVWRESDFGRNLTMPHVLADLAKFLDTEVTSRVIKDVGAIVARWQPDLIVSNDYEPNGRVIAERAGIPFVLASSSPRVPRTLRERLHSRVLRPSRRAGGLPEAGELDYTLRWLQLCFSPPGHMFFGPNDGMPAEAANQFGIRPQIAEFGAPFAPPVEPQTWDPRPTALCTFGTVFNKDPALLRMVIAAVAPRVRRLVFVLGPGLEPASLNPLPAGVELHANVALSSILPFVDYVVTHGGTATLAALHLQGKPCLLLPIGADQIINAAACQRTRLSVVRFHTPAAVNAGAYPIVPLTQACVEQAFDELIRNPEYRVRSEQFRHSLEELPPMQYAVQLLEQLAATRQPVLRQT